MKIVAEIEGMNTAIDELERDMEKDVGNGEMGVLDVVDAVLEMLAEKGVIVIDPNDRITGDAPKGI